MVYLGLMLTGEKSLCVTAIEFICESFPVFWMSKDIFIIIIYINVTVVHYNLNFYHTISNS